MNVLFEMLRRVNNVGAFGMLIYDGRAPVCGSLERTFLINSIWRPKIADGLWHCQRSKYHKGGYTTYEIFIPGHTRILFHKGNWPKDSDGCVLLGETYHDFDPAKGIQDPGLGRSGEGFDEFMQLADGVDSFFLRVTSA